MMNLGMGPNGAGTHEKDNGNESNKEPEENMEGEQRTTTITNMFIKGKALVKWLLVYRM